MPLDIPVVLLVFRRPEATARVLARMRTARPRTAIAALLGSRCRLADVLNDSGTHCDLLYARC